MASIKNPYIEWLESQSPPICSENTKKRIDRILAALNTDGEINIRLIRTLAFDGIPDEIKGLRGLLWRILLDYLPHTVSDWKRVLQSQRENYNHFRDLLMVEPDLSEEDHPLNMASSSKWNAYFQDQDIWEEIDKDVRRTRPDMNFFFSPSSLTYNDILQGNIPKRQYARPYITHFGDLFGQVFENEYLHTLQNNDNIEKHADVIARILFIYAKLNPGVRYVQGMNEILAPIYYCFCSDQHPEFSPYAEADSFYCFTSLMSEIRDNFVKTMDKSDDGVEGKLKQLHDLITKHDAQIGEKLDEMTIKPHFYGMKWILLLLTQEFSMPEILRLWDTIFSDAFRFKFFYHICVAKVMSVKDVLMRGDFAESLTALQHGSSVNVEELIFTASELAKLEARQAEEK
jgi:hypothetical protein